MLVVGWFQRTNGAVTSMVDNGASGGSTYTAAFNDAGADPVGWSRALYYTCSAASSVTSITGTATSESGHAVMIVVEYSGVRTSSCVDTVSSATAKTTSTTATSNSVTATAGDLGIGYFSQTTDNTNTFAASGTGWSLVTNQAETQSGSYLALTDNVNMSGGSQTAVATISASVAWVAYIATFKPPAVGGGGSKKKKVIFF